MSDYGFDSRLPSGNIYYSRRHTQTFRLFLFQFDTGKGEWLYEHREDEFFFFSPLSTCSPVAKQRHLLVQHAARPGDVYVGL